MGINFYLSICFLLILNPQKFGNALALHTNSPESSEAIALRSVQSIFLEGTLFDSGESEIYSSVLELSGEGGFREEDFRPGYALEYLLPTGGSVKTTCRVRHALAWAPRNDNDAAHSWFARVPGNQQGIGYRILKSGKVISERRFIPPSSPVQIECRETSNDSFTWHVHANIAEIAISYDHGKSWQATPALRSSGGTFTFSPSQLKINPHPWIFLQGSANGLIYTKLHEFNSSRPS